MTFVISCLLLLLSEATCKKTTRLYIKSGRNFLIERNGYLVWSKEHKPQEWLLEDGKVFSEDREKCWKTLQNATRVTKFYNKTLCSHLEPEDERLNGSIVLCGDGKVHVNNKCVDCKDSLLSSDKSKCVEKCSEGEFQEGKSCLFCLGVVDVSRKYCKACSGGLFPDSKGIMCVDKCQPGEENLGVFGCKKCSENTHSAKGERCEKCGWMHASIDRTKCVESCGKFSIITDDGCKSCAEGYSADYTGRECLIIAPNEQDLTNAIVLLTAILYSMMYLVYLYIVFRDRNKY